MPGRKSPSVVRFRVSRDTSAANARAKQFSGGQTTTLNADAVADTNTGGIHPIELDHHLNVAIAWL